MIVIIKNTKKLYNSKTYKYNFLSLSNKWRLPAILSMHRLYITNDFNHKKHSNYEVF